MPIMSQRTREYPRYVIFFLLPTPRMSLLPKRNCLDCIFSGRAGYRPQGINSEETHNNLHDTNELHDITTISIDIVHAHTTYTRDTCIHCFRHHYKDHDDNMYMLTYQNQHDDDVHRIHEICVGMQFDRFFLVYSLDTCLRAFLLSPSTSTHVQELTPTTPPPQIHPPPITHSLHHRTTLSHKHSRPTTANTH